MTKERLEQIKHDFIKLIPYTWPEGYHAVVVELVDEIERLQDEIFDMTHPA